MKLRFFIHAHHSATSNKYYFSADCFDMTSVGYVKVEEREIDFEPPPDAVLNAGMIDAYRQEQQRIRAEAQVRVAAIEESIQQMLSLEHKSDEAAEVAHDLA